MCFVRLSSFVLVLVLILPTDSYSKTELYSLDMSSFKAGTSKPLWIDAQSLFTTDAPATTTQTPGLLTRHAVGAESCTFLGCTWMAFKKNPL